MNINDLVKRAEQLIDQGKSIPVDGTHPEWGQLKGFRSGGLSFIERVYSRSHSHYVEFNTETDRRGNSALTAGIEILKVIKDELEGGWLFSIKSLVTAEVFADYLQMADYLIGKRLQRCSSSNSGKHAGGETASTI